MQSEAYRWGKKRGAFLLRKGVKLPSGYEEYEFLKKQLRLFTEYNLIDLSPMEETEFFSGLYRAYGEHAKEK